MATLPGTVIFRVNAGGPTIAATDGGPDFLADAGSDFLLNPGSSGTASFPVVAPGPTVAAGVPGAIFDTERFDFPGGAGAELQYAFEVPDAGDYEVRLFFGNGFSGTSAPGQRVFDVALEGSVPSSLNDIDPSARFGNQVGGTISNVVTVTDGTLNIDFLAGVENPLINGIEIVQLDGGSTPPPPPEPPQPGGGNGAAILQVTPNSGNVQASTFGNNSFRVINTGDIGIAQVDLDITNALFPDTVFDPFGLAGDTVSRPLTITTDGGTGVVAPSVASNIGVGGTSGFEGLSILFDETVDGGFEPGETLGFAIDADPNSVAGTPQGLLTAGSDPNFDVGGVSGAELIGSTFTVTFTDGTTATGQLQGDGSQAGSQGLAAQNSPNLPVSLTVNGLSAGSVGTFDAGPSVIVNGPVGQTARVVLARGFIQPVTNELFNGNAAQQAFAPTFQAQLDAVAAADFPANNAAEFQTVDVVLTGADQDISNLFEFSELANFDFPGEDRLPLGFVASIIDPTNLDLSIGPVTEPIILTAEPPNELSLSFDPGSISEGDGLAAATGTVTRTGDTTASLSVALTNSDTSEVTVPATVVIPAGEASVDFTVDAVDDSSIDDTQAVTVIASATGFASASTNLEVADDDAPAPPDPDPSPGDDTVLFRVNAGGPTLAATDGGPDFLADAGSDFLLNPGSSGTASFPVVEPGPTVDASVPGAIFDTERFDFPGGAGTELQYAFDVPAAGEYEVRLFLGNGFSGTSASGERVFDVALEGSVPSSLDAIDLVAAFGDRVGGVVSNVVTVTDGTLNIDFLAEVENPLVNGIEIVQLG